MSVVSVQIFSLNRRVQAQNRAPDDFPGFIREGFDVTVVGEGYEMDGNGYATWFIYPCSVILKLPHCMHTACMLTVIAESLALHSCTQYLCEHAAALLEEDQPTLCLLLTSVIVLLGFIVY